MISLRRRWRQFGAPRRLPRCARLSQPVCTVSAIEGPLARKFKQYLFERHQGMQPQKATSSAGRRGSARCTAGAAATTSHPLSSRLRPRRFPPPNTTLSVATQAEFPPRAATQTSRPACDCSDSDCPCPAAQLRTAAPFVGSLGPNQHPSRPAETPLGSVRAPTRNVYGSCFSFRLCASSTVLGPPPGWGQDSNWEGQQQQSREKRRGTGAPPAVSTPEQATGTENDSSSSSSSSSSSLFQL